VAFGVERAEQAGTDRLVVLDHEDSSHVASLRHLELLTLVAPSSHHDPRTVESKNGTEEGRKMRRATPLLMLVSLGVVALAACGSSASTTASTTATTGRTPVTTAAPTPSSSGPSSAPPQSATVDTTVAGAVDPNAPEVNGPGDIPDNQVFVPYADTGGRYVVSVPEGWARTDLVNGASFTDKNNIITVEATPMASAPTVASVKANDVPHLSKLKGFVLGDVTVVKRTAGDAVLVTYSADSAPNPVTNKSVTVVVERYEFWHNGVAVVLTLEGAKGADNVDPWRKVTNSFAFSM